MPALKLDGRHGEWVRPLATMVFIFSFVIAATLFVHDLVVGSPVDAARVYGGPVFAPDARLAYFFLAYLCVMIGCRYADCGSYIFYESVWCCNTSLLLSSLGILNGRPLLVGAAIAGVMCDQAMWYIDCGLYLTTGSFKVGVARYLLWPQTSWSKRYLCTHHLWFMPLALAALGWHLPAHSFLLSCLFTSLSTGLCRYLTPMMWNDIYSGHLHYMNINAGHEFWRDVKIPILHAFDKSPPVIYLPFMFVCVNTGLNGPFVLIMDLLLRWVK
jgi:hypothetical protein